MKQKPPIELNLDNLIFYEITGTWWTGFVPFPSLVARYIIWRTQRKIARVNKFHKLHKQNNA